jgi:predicted transcriptional regulator
MGAAAAWAAVAVSATSAYVSNKNANARAEEANQQAEQNAKKTADATAQATNKANQKKPDSDALLSANLTNGKAGQASTMLTGAGGIDPNLLTLGKTTLLGGGGT